MSKLKVKSFKGLKGLTFGTGGNTVNPRFPKARNGSKKKEKPNTQTMSFNDSIPSR